MGSRASRCVRGAWMQGDKEGDTEGRGSLPRGAELACGGAGRELGVQRAGRHADQQTTCHLSGRPCLPGHVSEGPGEDGGAAAGLNAHGTLP